MKTNTQKGFCLSILLLGLTCLQNGYAQINDLLPKTLLLETKCAIDTNAHLLFQNFMLGKTYVFYSPKNIEVNKIFADIALKDTGNIFNIHSNNQKYPYFFSAFERLTAYEIKINLGEEHYDAIDQNGNSRHLIKEVNLNEIRAMNFVEEWILDTTLLLFKKNVLGIIPLRVYSESNGREDIAKIRQTVLIENKPANNSPALLIAKIKYEVLLFNPIVKAELKWRDDEYEHDDNYELFNSPLFSSYSRKALRTFIWNSATSGRLKCYDFQTNQIISNHEDILVALGKTQIQHEILDMTTGITSNLTVDEYRGKIKSVIFCEEWYFQPSTNHFSKQVVGIVPVLWDDENATKKPCFTLWLDNSKIF